MRLRDFLLLMTVCLIWALNVIIGKIILTRYALPPFYYAGIRFMGVALLLSPLLRPLPRNLMAILGVGVLVGAAHFGLLFLGLTAATPSSAAIVLQFGIPLTALLSVLFLGERISLQRGAGIAIAFAGVVTVIWNPGEMQASLGLLAVVGSTISIAVGSILLKRLDPIHPLRLQAWVAVSSCGPLMLGSAMFEHGQLTGSIAGGWVFILATLFSIFIVTMVAHTLYFSLLQRYPASMIAPLTLAMPIMTILLGVILTGDTLTQQTVIGSVLALCGVLLTLKGKGPAPQPVTPT
jgi:drug/metabolite transporter (DMT)-like permease